MPSQPLNKQMGLFWACYITLIWFLRLRIQGFRHCATPFLNQQTRTPPRLLKMHDADRVYQLLLRTQKLPWSSCLTRSLALCDNVSRKGMQACLRIGIAQKSGFKAHAWVETAHASFGESEQTVFTQLQSPPQL